jgi:L-histidine N-alpha-methyltransferase
VLLLDFVPCLRPEERVELGLRANTANDLRARAPDLTVRFRRGERLRSEISTKSRRGLLTAELAAAALWVSRGWTDGAGVCSLSLIRHT